MIVGDGAVGSSAFLGRFTEGKMKVDYVPTIFENYNKECHHNGQTIILR